MKDYRTLEDFPVTYQRQFAPAVKEMLRDWIKESADGPPLSDDYNLDNWLADTSLEIADRRFGIPETDHPSGEEKHFRMMDWRTLVEREAKQRILEL